MRKWALVIVLVATAVGLTFASAARAGVNELRDREAVPQWAVEAVDVLMKEGILHGYPDGTFRPNQPITRAEMALVVAALVSRVDQQKTDPQTRALIGALRDEFSAELKSLRRALAKQESAIGEVRETAEVARSQAEENRRLLSDLSSKLGGLNWSGDFRFRVELNSEDLKDKDNQRQRIRLRLRSGLQINPNTQVNFRLTTGRKDPLSGNQSLGNFNAGFDFRLDYAYLHWKNLSPSGSGVGIYAGSFPTQTLMYNNSLVFDDDMTFQGLLEQFEVPAGRGKVRLSLLQNLVAESKDRFNEDSWVIGAQLGADDVFAKGLDLFAGYYTLSNPELFSARKSEFFRPVDFNQDGSVGNEDLLPGQVPGLDDYTILHLGASYSFKSGNTPVKVFADYVRNLDANFPAEGATGPAAFLENEDEWGSDIGVVVGSLKRPGDWKFHLEWRDLGAFATFPWFADSDFKATNIHGFKVSLGYQYNKNTIFKYSGFFGEIDNRFGVISEDVRRNRQQFDVIFKF